MSLSCLSPRSNFIGAHVWLPYLVRNWSTQSLRSCVSAEAESLYSPIEMTFACAPEAKTSMQTTAATAARILIGVPPAVGECGLENGAPQSAVAPTVPGP